MWPFSPRKKSIYLDYAAATPTRSEVLAAMAPFWMEDFGNPSSIHFAGQKALLALHGAREKAARTLRVRTDDIIFSSGGTESNNLAITGSIKAMLDAGVRAMDIEIISTPLEHPSISETLKVAMLQGVKVIMAPVGEDGLVLVPEFKKLLSSRTRFVTIGYVNSETGVVEDIGRLARAVRAFEKENGLTILFHTDAAQAPLWLPCALDALKVDLMSLDAGKCRGPKGVGILAKRHQVKLKSITAGGSQEAGLRPGTEPLPLVVGAAVALELAQAEASRLTAKILPIRDYFIKRLEEIPTVVLNGSRAERTANNVNVSIPGLDTEFLVVALSQSGIAASTKSACSGAGGGVSFVVLNMTKDRERSLSTVRFTLSPDITKKDIDYTMAVIKEHLRNSQLPN